MEITFAQLSKKFAENLDIQEKEEATINNLKQHKFDFFFLVNPLLQNTDKQSQLFGQAPGKSHSDPLKTKNF